MTAPARAHPPMPRDATAALLPPAFFAAAVAFFTAALVLLPGVARELAAHFYQPSVLAVTHMLTLGWITMTMMGVLYRYVPGLTKAPLPRPRLALAQGAVFLAGVVGLVVSFWIGHWTGATWAAAALTLAAVLLCANLWPLLLHARGRGVAEVGVAIGTALLVAAAGLGLLLAAGRMRPLLGGGTLSNLGAHAHLAALGWVGVVISALSLRFLPAFLMPTVDLTAAARVQVVVLATGVVALVTALLAQSALVAAAAVWVAAALIAHLALLAGVVRHHRMPLDWTAGHAMAGGGWLVATVAAGVALALPALGAHTPAGARLAAAYGAAAILGWMSNLQIGVSYKLFPGFVVAARAQRGRRPVPVAVLGVPAWLAPMVFVLHNAGLAVMVAGLVAGGVGLVIAGAVALAAGGLCYGAGTARTLAFVLRDPPGGGSGLDVLP